MKKSVWTFLALLTVGVTQTAWGEEAPKDSTKVVDIEEVVVIATPKENSRLRQQALSATSFSQADMRGNAVRSVKSLSSLVPNLFTCVLRGTDFEAKDVFDAARNGDALAAREVDEMADTLGLALSIIAETVDPEMFLVGGGVARAGEVLFVPLTAHYKEYAFRSCKETPIRQASLGNDAGIYGAVRLIVGG